MAIDLGNVLEFNADQLLHVRIVQQLLKHICDVLMEEALDHDKTKFRAEEFMSFLENVFVRRKAKSGTDEDYQKGLKSQGVQYHITHNQHHPEYWAARNKKMPITDVIVMYFDWMSRTVQREDPSTFNGFWEYNLDKLRGGQEHAIPIVEELRREFPPERFCLRHFDKVEMKARENGDADSI